MLNNLQNSSLKSQHEKEDAGVSKYARGPIPFTALVSVERGVRGNTVATCTFVVFFTKKLEWRANFHQNWIQSKPLSSGCGAEALLLQLCGAQQWMIFYLLIEKWPQYIFVNLTNCTVTAVGVHM